MSQPIIDELRKLNPILERIARALERAVGIEPPETPGERAAATHAQRPALARPPQGEPVRAPVPQPRAAAGEPPPAKMGPRCNVNGPVYVGHVPIRCSLDKGHEGQHEHAGYEWPAEEPAPAPAPAVAETSIEAPTQTVEEPAP